MDCRSRSLSASPSAVSAAVNNKYPILQFSSQLSNPSYTPFTPWIRYLRELPKVVIEGHESFEQEYKIDCSSPKSELKEDMKISNRNIVNLNVGFSASECCNKFENVESSCFY
uniref:Uncharacterized protein n=1 Tax=Solanum lycopersicum TaxID=4081 RepID=A0A3Q7GPW5_SOLLC